MIIIDNLPLLVGQDTLQIFTLLGLSTLKTPINTFY